MDKPITLRRRPADLENTRSRETKIYVDLTAVVQDIQICDCSAARTKLAAAVRLNSKLTPRLNEYKQDLTTEAGYQAQLYKATPQHLPLLTGTGAQAKTH